MKIQHALLQREIDPTLTILFKETNPFHPEIISHQNFSIIIEDWKEGTYSLVNSNEKGNEHFQSINLKPIKTIYDLNTFWKAVIGNELTYMGRIKKDKPQKTFKRDKTGEIHKSNSCGDVEIIDQKGCNNCTIKFLEDGSIIYDQKYGKIKRGQIKNPFKRVYYGNGYMG